MIMEIYRERHDIAYIEIDTGYMGYSIRYQVFDMILENVPELYAEMSSWETNGYVSNYQLVII